MWAISTTFGPNTLVSFRVWTDEVVGRSGVTFANVVDSTFRASSLKTPGVRSVAGGASRNAYVVATVRI